MCWADAVEDCRTRGRRSGRVGRQPRSPALCARAGPAAGGHPHARPRVAIAGRRDRRTPGPVPQYTQLLGEFAEAALRRAFEEAAGGLPPDINTELYVIRGAAGPALVHTADRAHDLLVVGAGRRGRIRHPLSAGIARYCLAHATCAIVAVPPPRLQTELPAQWRRKSTVDRLIDQFAEPRARSDAR